MKPIDIEKASRGGRSEWEMNLKVLAKDYLRFWFIIDALAVAPSAFDALPFLQDEDESFDLSTLRTIRVLRLARLGRMVKASRVVTRLWQYVPISSTTKVVVLLAQSLLLVHWYACILAVTTTFANNPLQTWLGTHGYCMPDGTIEGGGSGFADERGVPSVHRVGSTRVYVRCVEASFLYLRCVRWAMGLIYANGSTSRFKGPFERVDDGNVYMTELNDAEEVLVLIMKIIGLGFW